MSPPFDQMGQQIKERKDALIIASEHSFTDFERMAAELAAGFVVVMLLEILENGEILFYILEKSP